MMHPNEFDDYLAMYGRRKSAREVQAEAANMFHSRDYLASAQPRPVEPTRRVSPLQVLAVVAGLLIGVVGGMVLERHWTDAIAEDVK